MPIHDCFSGLRHRLGMPGNDKMGFLPNHTGYTANTRILSGVATASAEKTSKKQIDTSASTPATPETPSSIQDIEYWREAYEERAAIYEFDAGHCRNEAECLAMNDMLLHFSALHGISLESDVLHRFRCVLHLATGFNHQHIGT